MDTLEKKKTRLRKRLGALRDKNGSGKCWVCGSTSGVKTSRESYGTCCRRCIKIGATNFDVEEYEELFTHLDREAGGKL